ncbi:MAG: hypothetical protein J4G19_03135 [Pseudomonadales bacterium]|nr:hypothetical protein [Pseudomonadales bacterium]
MVHATINLHSKFQIDKVDDRIFGGFLEHLGRCIYHGVYDSDHQLSDKDGLRSDVSDALKELGVTIVRYPGGNFASGYHWEDGVGDRTQRPTVRELAWQSMENNQFGTDEFINLCRKLNWQPMLAVNLGTGSPEEAQVPNSPINERVTETTSRFPCRYGASEMRWMVHGSSAMSPSTSTVTVRRWPPK